MKFKSLQIGAQFTVNNRTFTKSAVNFATAANGCEQWFAPKANACSMYFQDMSVTLN